MELKDRSSRVESKLGDGEHIQGKEKFRWGQGTTLLNSERK